MLRVLLLLPCALWLAGCSYISVSEDPYFDREAYAAHPPRSLAIAPFVNNVEYEEAGLAARKAVYSAFSTLNYKDVEMEIVDRHIHELAVTANKKPEELDRWYIAQPELADAVMFGEVQKLSRLFLLFYSQIRVDLDLIVVDTATKKYLYRNHFITRNRQFNLPSSWFGIGSSFLSSIWHMRGDQVERSMDAAAKALEEKYQETLDSNLTDSSRMAEIVIETPRKEIKAGDQITIKVKTLKHRNVSASISIASLNIIIPLSETAPGEYLGSYSIKNGDNARFTYAKIHIGDPAKPGEELVFSADDQPFVIDTIPPVPWEIRSWQSTDKGIMLQFARSELISPSSDRAALVSSEDPRPVLFYLYRGAVGGELKLLGQSDNAEFVDVTAHPGQQYEYALIAEDAAGNRNAPSSKKITIPSQP